MEHGHTNGEVKSEMRNGGDLPPGGFSEEPKDIEELLRREIESNRRSVQRLSTWGMLGVLCLMGYLAWLYHSIEDNFFNPQFIAAFVSGTIEDNLPGIIGQGKREAIASAPYNVEALSLKLQGTIPQIRRAAEQQIETIYLQMPLLRESLNEALRDYFNENRAELREFAEAHNDREFVKHFMAHLIREIDQELFDEIGAKESKELQMIQEQSLGQLVMLNEKLKALSEKSPYYMSRKDIVARRAAAVWASMLHETTAELNQNPQ